MFIQSMDMINGKEKGGIIKVKSSGLKKIAYPPVRDKVSVGESLDDWSDKPDVAEICYQLLKSDEGNNEIKQWLKFLTADESF